MEHYQSAQIRIVGDDVINGTICANTLGHLLIEYSQLVDKYSKIVSSAEPNTKLCVLERGKNVFIHKQFSNTQCPLHMEDCLDAIVSRANELLGVAQAVNPQPPAPAPARKSNEQLADEVIAGHWGVGQDRKNRLGALYAPVQALVNKKLGY